VSQSFSGKLRNLFILSPVEKLTSDRLEALTGGRFPTFCITMSPVDHGGADLCYEFYSDGDSGAMPWATSGEKGISVTINLIPLELLRRTLEGDQAILFLDCNVIAN
jgi:hypothetical protein